MKIVSFFSAFALFTAFAVMQGCDKRPQNINFAPGVTDNIAAAAQKEGLNVFVAALKASGMDKDLELLGTTTVFAPNDAAFQAAGITTANVATALPLPVLRAVLRNHMISGRVASAGILPGPNATYSSVNRDFLSTSTYAGATGGIFFNGKKVVKADIAANNGLIHVVDGVLLPPAGNLMATINANSNLTFLSAAITRAGLEATLTTSNSTLLTIFAPTNAAFQAAGFADIAAINAADPAVLTSILTYHVIPAASLTNAVLTSPLNRNGRGFKVDFTNNTTLTTANGGTVAVTVNGAAVSVKGTSNPSASNITTADILFYGNNVSTVRPGVLHIIDRVLLP